MNYIGIDLGGTNIKAAVVTETGEILQEISCPTYAEKGVEAVVDTIIRVIARLSLSHKITAIGIGCPGTVDDESGKAVYLPNLKWVNVELRAMLEKRTGFRARLVNDANAAALGEALAGCGRDTESIAVVTLGTGVGGGVVLNGELLTGYTGAAVELGHMVIARGGEQCSCGRRGCFEQYASGTALNRLTKQAIEREPQGKMAELLARDGELSGAIPFEAAALGDAGAIAVVEEYTDCLAVGLANIVNIFFPEKIALTGGVAKQGEALLIPLRKKVSTMTFGDAYLARHTEIVSCDLGYHAGLIGAALFASRK